MLLLKNLFLFLSLIVLHIALAVRIAVQRDTSPAQMLGEDNAAYVWTGTAEFNNKVTDGQLVTICDDAFKSMASSMREHMTDLGNKNIPTVMVAMVYESVPGETWKVYLASSSRGRQNIIYLFKNRDHERCAEMNPFIPERYRQEFKRCTDDLKEGDKPRHKNDASCGEQNALLMILAEQGKMPKVTKETSSIVARQGYIKDVKDKEGKILEKKQLGKTRTIAPCSEENTFGCKEVLNKYFGNSITVITEAQEAEPYVDNQPVRVDFQPIFNVRTTEA